MTPNRPARLVMLIDSLGLGGAERLLVTYLQYFDTTHFEPRVCALDVRDGNPTAADIQRLGIPVDLIPIPKLQDLTGLPRLVRYLRQQRADLLHTQLQFADALGSIAAKILRIPTISTLHTRQGPARNRSSLWRRQFTWWSLRHFCDQVIAVSEDARQHYLELGHLSPGQVKTLYNGIDLSQFTCPDEAHRLAQRQTLGSPSHAPLLITVAVLRPAKGIQYLIEALPVILKSIPEVHYLVVGSGEYEATLKEAAQQHGVAERVIFAGVRNDIPDLLALSDIFVLPTLDEALPTVLAEAMAAQKPIVASRVGGVPEMVEHGCNGLLVPPGDPAILAEACLQILQNSDQAGIMGRAGREIVEQRFNIRRQAQQLSELYQELLVKHEGKRAL
jgi:glycosyltransferase involved in cell wall biosynthesis